MTPAEMAVCADMLRGCTSNGVVLDEDTVARMLAHHDPQREMDLCIRTAVRVRSASAHLAAFGGDVTAIINRIDALDCTPHIPPFEAT